MVVKVGIDTLAMYTSHYALNLADLAAKRGTDPEKYHTGLGQYVMSVPPPGEDIVTMAANAAQKALEGIDRNDIEMLLFATESSIDQSKAAGIYVHQLLDLPARCRVVELKQACYSATAALQLVLPHLREHPNKKVLLIASDVARYGLATPGESSQGCGSVAMVLSAQPRIIAFEAEYGVVTENVMDFWRPNYLHHALVDGKHSSKLYLTMLEHCFLQYQALSQRGFLDHDYYCYHVPVPRLVEKAHYHLAKLSGHEQLFSTLQEKQIQYSLQYGRRIGNCYTASLFLAFTSLLDHAKEDLTGKRIGFYSYGSGCVAEFFSGLIQPAYREALQPAYHAALLSSRTLLSYAEYADFYQFNTVEDGSLQEIPHYHTGAFRLAKLHQHKRIYETIVTEPATGGLVIPLAPKALAQGMS